MNTKNNTSKEWLETNGLGGFASGSVHGAPSRRYHGLLCASLNPPTDRHLLVSHLVEKVCIEDQMIALSTEHYLHHRPEAEIRGAFSARPYAHWSYVLPGGSLEKSITMLEDENTTMVRYKNTSTQPLSLFLKPLTAARDYHTLRQEETIREVSLVGNAVTVQCEDQPPIYMASNQANWQLRSDYYHELYYNTEASRGFEATETNFLAAELEARLAPDEVLLLRFSTEVGVVSEQVFMEKEAAYQNHKINDRFKKDVALAAEQFLVHRESSNGSTILAGYPWFTDWGRDTLIALRDFQDFLAPAEAQLIIKTFLQYQQHGLIPNRFPDDPEEAIEYNTIDASLWLFVSVWELHEKKPDTLFIEQIYEALTSILEAHLVGTHFNIEVLESGLLSGGEAPWQLTWMDARIGDHTVTPRRGCAIEINMLWYNALKIYQALSKEVGQKLLVVDPWIKKFEKSFEKTFWNAEKSALYDVIKTDGTVDDALRPNQIYALSLPFTSLSKKRQKQILQQCSEKLYTPLGLRTLAPEDENFKPAYDGDTWARDTAYHQGTVWPFLLREYWQAYLRVQGKRKTKKLLATELKVLENHFYHDAGIGSVSEVFDGKDPVHGKGCPQQAWSVAALWYMLKLKEFL